MDTLHKILKLIQSNFPSDKAFEDALGIPNRTVNDWKRNKSKSFLKMIPQIASLFNVSSDYLLGTENKKSSAPEGTELKGVYLNFAMDAQENGIDPDDIKLAIETIKRLRGQDNK